MIIKYGLVGLLNTFIAASIMAVMGWLGMHYLLYTNLAYFLAFINSYLLNGIWTFQGNRLSISGFILFSVVNLLVMGATSVFQFALIEWADIPEIGGVLCGMAFYTVSGYFLNQTLEAVSKLILDHC